MFRNRAQKNGPEVTDPFLLSLAGALDVQQGAGDTKNASEEPYEIHDTLLAL